MGDRTGISWTEATWNPLVGCQHASPGCDGCYAAREAFGRLSGVPVYAGLAHRRTPDELPRFTGEIRTLPERLDQPLRWRKPRRVFVNSMSDLFHPAVPNAFIEDAFAVMARAEQHTFQVLTKRPKRMAALSRSPGFHDAVIDKAGGDLRPWPLPNVWLGTSVEDQAWADRRIPDLLSADAAVRFLSAEPLLGPIDLTAGAIVPDWIGGPGGGSGARHPLLDWVIVGGESGPGARPMHPDWVRQIRDDCIAEGVAFHFKQWGEWRPCAAAEYAGPGRHLFVAPDGRHVPDAVDTPGARLVGRFGKKAAGRLLDGRTWDEYPEPVTVTP